jgi:hypothetical protein
LIVNVMMMASKGVDLKAHDGCVGVVYPGLRGLMAHLPGAS